MIHMKTLGRGQKSVRYFVSVSADSSCKRGGNVQESVSKSVRLGNMKGRKSEDKVKIDEVKSE